MFKKLKQWLSEKLRELIEIDNYINKQSQIDKLHKSRLNKHGEILADYIDKSVKSELRIKQLEKELDFFKSLCQVGVDAHMRTDSWAVVCLDGKPEYVNFVRLDSRDARDIKSFLKVFEKSDVKVDAPYGMIDAFKW